MPKKQKTGKSNPGKSNPGKSNPDKSNPGKSNPGLLDLLYISKLEELVQEEEVLRKTYENVLEVAQKNKVELLEVQSKIREITGNKTKKKSVQNVVQQEVVIDLEENGDNPMIVNQTKLNLNLPTHYEHQEEESEEST